MAVDATMPTPVVSGKANNSGASSGSSGTGTGMTTSSQGIADNFQTFLTLLTTQLQNQNPLDPLDTNQFTQQLVQFAGVEQQLKTNDALSQLVTLQQTTQATQALGFVGSSDIAQYIYSTAAANGKRSQCFGGAKNHMIIMPDADLDQAADALIGAGYGSAGERCMAISVAVPVGEQTAERLRAKLIDKVNGLRVGHSLDPKADYGPLVTKAALERVKGHIGKGTEQGAELGIDASILGGSIEEIDGRPFGNLTVQVPAEALPRAQDYLHAHDLRTEVLGHVG